MLFFCGLSPKNAQRIPSRETKIGSVKKLDKLSHFPDFCLGHTFRPGPRDPKRMT